jgi:hypothetical protein
MLWPCDTPTPADWAAPTPAAVTLTPREGELLWLTHDDDDTSRWLWLAVAAGMALWLAVAAGILLAVWLASAVIA